MDKLSVMYFNSNHKIKILSTYAVKWIFSRMVFTRGEPYISHTNFFSFRTSAVTDSKKKGLFFYFLKRN